MKKNNYVQQLRADNPVFIVWKKNSFVYETALCFLFFVLLGFYVLTTATPNVL